MMDKGYVDISFKNAVPELIDNLQKVSDAYLDEFNEHKAFTYLVAELFENTTDEFFHYTDGAKDGGIDFFIQAAQSYILYQCKCPDISILEASENPPVFDDTAIKDILSAIQMIRDPKGSYDVKKEIKMLRADYQADLAENPERTKLKAAVAVLGDLTSAAKEFFNSTKEKLAKESIAFDLITWEDVYHSIHALDRPFDIDFSIDLTFDDINKDILQHREYCYALIHAFDYYKAFREHEWNLFDWNVRYELKKSRINQKIVASLKTDKGRKRFHHYNNGVLISCRSYQIKKNKSLIRLIGPQIINGCQTVRSICNAYEDLSPEEQKHFRENVYVQTKIIQSMDIDFIMELVEATNDQNPMNPRNLKSNHSEQKNIKKSFSTIKTPFFYQRKDGEFDSLLATHQKMKGFRKSDYKAGKNCYRIIDNQDLARSWFSFIGHSDKALKGGLQYFEDEELYDLIFKKQPTDEFWHYMSSNPYFEPSTDMFEIGTPSAYQYLLSICVDKYIFSRRIPMYINKKMAIERGKKSGALSEKSSDEEVSVYLKDDEEYWLNILINNMREVYIELFSFILSRRYGVLDALTCQKILSMPAEAEYIKNAFDKKCMPSQKQDGNSIIGPIYAYISYCVSQYFQKYRAEIEGAARLKSYLWNRKTVNKIKDLVIEYDKKVKTYDRDWKVINKTFVESLPDI